LSGHSKTTKERVRSGESRAFANVDAGRLVRAAVEANARAALGHAGEHATSSAPKPRA
jgi:hypothetical protein